MLEIKNVKKIQIRRSRFGYESESEYYSSCKNHESESEYSGFGGKDSNPNPNIRYNTETETYCYDAKNVCDNNTNNIFGINLNLKIINKSII